MEKEVFLTKMKTEVLDTERDISLDMPLDTIEEWESLSFVSFIAMAKEAGFTQVNRKVVNAAKTVDDLFQLVR